jgi:hypothetical protein
MRVDTAVAYFEIISRHLPVMPEENYENHQNRRVQGKESNLDLSSR